MRTADPSVDGRRSAASRTAIGEGISSRRPRADNWFYLYIVFYMYIIIIISYFKITTSLSQSHPNFYVLVIGYMTAKDGLLSRRWGTKRVLCTSKEGYKPSHNGYNISRAMNAFATNLGTEQATPRAVRHRSSHTADICILNGRSMTGDNGELTEPAGQRTRNYLNSLIHWRIDPPQINFRTRDARM